ncbi:MAG: TatD family hydrolase [Oscillospiraceae bacterium]|nr:TatD family hydrolase [Oscillospiraceae bacterium]
MIDGHVHVTAELLPYLKQVRCIANADSAAEYTFLKNSGLPLISAGVHPWKADVTAWEELEPVLREVPVIGEIGLDSEWCSVDLDVQRAVFHRQLALAMELGKPVILHTKGMEREILETIRQYPNRYLVHWYACGDYLQEYIDLGCWFTVGPDVLQDETVERLAGTVPIDRLLIESDGIEGIAWGQSRDVTAAEYPMAMQRHLETVAQLRGMDAEHLLERMERNLKAFLKL